MKYSLKNWLGNQVLGAQRILSSFGEKLGWQWLIYNPLVTMGFARAARRNAPIVVQSILTTLGRPKNAADYGCGLGIYVQEFIKQGVNAVGLEYNPRYRKIGKKKGLTILPWDISHPATQGRPEQQHDLAICLEVAEHIPSNLADELVAVLVSSAQSIVFTAAQPGQGGTGHINEQPREYWIEKFTEAGASYDEGVTFRLKQEFTSGGAFSYLANNLCVFKNFSNF
jgi:hypothetical protein